ncbi:MAG TPA: GH25 family lysozyme [Actinomycetota bacterium]|nr:GH25 family lysozyme [Actinomycetota bacterium]
MRARPNRRKVGPAPGLAAWLGALLVVGALAAPRAARADQAYLPGVDVSHWQGDVDWTAVAGSGVRFAILKATEGRTFVDDRYQANRAGATAAGLVVTAYHFARPDGRADDPVVEADHFVDTAGLAAGDIVPALDLEVTGGLSTDALIRWTTAWLERVRERLGVRPMIYSSPGFWKSAMGDTRAFADAGYRFLWVAHWTSNSQPTVPADNWGGHGWTFWQWTSCASVPGIAGCVDGDRYNGTDLSGVLVRKLTVTATPGGTVTGDPPGIVCGTGGGSCERLADPDGTVTLSATPDPGGEFLRWSGACSGTGPCSLTMTGDRTVGATFGFPVSVTPAGDGKGTVQSSAPGIACGTGWTACRATFVAGSAVTLTATPFLGSAFLGWSGACSGTGPCVLAVDRAHDVVANFLDVSPKASLARPATLISPVAVRFDEPVGGVSAASVVLRVAGDARDLLTSLACLDGAGSRVDCGAGRVRSVLVQPADPLLPGQRYAVVVNPPGAAPLVADPEGNPVEPGTTKRFRAATSVQEVNPWSTYSWARVRAERAFGGSYLAEHRPGAELTFRFTGSSVRWYGVRGPDRGLAAVLVDGVPQGTVDQYAPTVRFGAGRSFGDFEPGDHVLTIRVLGKKGHAAATGTFVSVDAFSVDGGPVQPTPPVETSWRRAGARGASGGAYVVSDLPGATATWRFRGTGFDWYTVTGPGQGVARVFVDGVLRATVDNAAPTTAFGVRRSVRGLPDRVHSVRVVVAARPGAAGGRPVAVDRWVAVP